MNRVKIKINNAQVFVQSGNTVASAILENDTKTFRRSVTGKNRFPLCGMGICFECRVSINGKRHQKSCQILVKDGMEITTDE